MSKAMILSPDHARQLVAQHGSPLLLVSTNTLQQRYRILADLLSRVGLYYAVKSNPHPAVLKALAEAGSGFDVASEAELDAVLKYGVASERIIYTNPIKPMGAIGRLSEKGVATYFYDNDLELEKIARDCPGVRVILRINVINPNCVVDLGQKFGCHVSAAEPLLMKAIQLGLHPAGLSFHVGSQTSIPQPYADTISACKNIFNHMALQGLPLEVLDIGGGFPIPYKANTMPIDAFCKPIAAALDRYFPNTKIIAEPGRFISGPAAQLVTRVIGKETRNGIVWYYLDDGIYGSFSGCIFDHASYQFTSLNEGELRPCVLAGPTCDSFDIISSGEYLPPMEIGDILIAENMGAYTNASATTFNGIPLTKVVEIN
ncbi:MAG TPA: type III PLP-dependent enzyme [Acidiferrobacteraceae bacterium]|nr:type III PLP-dependent enzyme [Acidiferrobacteraceae bacterium]